jgi:hypothetical protein
LAPSTMVCVLFNSIRGLNPLLPFRGFNDGKRSPCINSIPKISKKSNQQTDVLNFVRDRRLIEMAFCDIVNILLNNET